MSKRFIATSVSVVFGERGEKIAAFLVFLVEKKWLISLRSLENPFVHFEENLVAHVKENFVSYVEDNHVPFVSVAYVNTCRVL